MDKIGAVMVIGGGIGGMQASMDLADSGYKVYLAEATTSIGLIHAFSCKLNTLLFKNPCLWPP